MSVVALVTDLFFGTKVRSTAQAVGAPLKMVRSTTDLLASAADASVVLIDMNATGIDTVEAISKLKQTRPELRILAFLSHVQQDLASAAHAAGADEVMPRSKFSAQLPEILKAHSSA